MSAQRDNLLKQCPCDPARWPKCPHGWHLKLRHDGQRFSVSLDTYAKRRGLPRVTTRGEAETLAVRIEGEIRAGTFTPRPAAPSAAPAATATASSAGCTVDQAMGAVEAQRAPGWPSYVPTVVEVSEVDPETVKHITGRLRRLAATDVPDVGRFGALAVGAVTPAIAGTAYRVATKGMANSTKHKYGQALRGFFEWTVAQGYRTGTPITKEAKLTAGEDARRNRRVHPEEETNLLQAATETIAEAGTRLVALLILAFDLGGRLGELLALQWRDILWDEGEQGRVCFAARERGARKTKTPRAVPMTARVRAVLRTLQRDARGQAWPPTAYVVGDAIGGKVKNVRKAWVTGVLRAYNHEPRWIKSGKNTLAAESRALFKTIDLHFHDIRHECALRWLARGYTLGMIAVLLGHHDLDTLRVYLGLAARDALREAEALNVAAPLEADPVQLRRHDGQAVTVAGTGPTGTKPALNCEGAALRVVRRKEAHAS